MRLIVAIVALLSLATVVAAQTKIYLPVILKTPPTPPKKGVSIYPFPPVPSACNEMELLGAHWYYNWTMSYAPDCSPDERFVPMVYDGATVNNPAAIPHYLDHGRRAGWLLGFNEPDLTQWANMTPLEGAIAWRQLETIVEGQGIKLVSPAPSQFNPAWLPQMVAEYQALYGGLPRFDAIGAHYYGPAQATKDYLMAQRDTMRGNYPGVKLWLTEFNSCLLQQQDYASYMADLLPWLEAQDWIERYAYFIAAPAPGFPETYSACTLMTDEGVLTASGAVYAAY